MNHNLSNPVYHGKSTFNGGRKSQLLDLNNKIKQDIKQQMKQLQRNSINDLVKQDQYYNNNNEINDDNNNEPSDNYDENNENDDNAERIVSENYLKNINQQGIDFNLYNLSHIEESNVNTFTNLNNPDQHSNKITSNSNNTGMYINNSLKNQEKYYNRKNQFPINKSNNIYCDINNKDNTPNNNALMCTFNQQDNDSIIETSSFYHESSNKKKRENECNTNKLINYNNYISNQENPHIINKNSQTIDETVDNLKYSNNDEKIYDYSTNKNQSNPIISNIQNMIKANKIDISEYEKKVEKQFRLNKDYSMKAKINNTDKTKSKMNSNNTNNNVSSSKLHINKSNNNSSSLVEINKEQQLIPNKLSKQKINIINNNSNSINHKDYSIIEINEDNLKLINNNRHSISNINHLYNPPVKSTMKTLRIMEEKKKRELKELEECTFKPKINSENVNKLYQKRSSSVVYNNINNNVNNSITNEQDINDQEIEELVDSYDEKLNNLDNNNTIKKSERAFDDYYQRQLAWKQEKQNKIEKEREIQEAKQREKYTFNPNVNSEINDMILNQKLTDEENYKLFYLDNNNQKYFERIQAAKQLKLENQEKLNPNYSKKWDESRKRKTKRNSIDVMSGYNNDNNGNIGHINSRKSDFGYSKYKSIVDSKTNLYQINNNQDDNSSRRVIGSTKNSQHAFGNAGDASSSISNRNFFDYSLDKVNINNNYMINNNYFLDRNNSAKINSKRNSKNYNASSNVNISNLNDNSNYSSKRNFSGNRLKNNIDNTADSSYNKDNNAIAGTRLNNLNNACISNISNRNIKTNQDNNGNINKKAYHINNPNNEKRIVNTNLNINDNDDETNNNELFLNTKLLDLYIDNSSDKKDHALISNNSKMNSINNNIKGNKISNSEYNDLEELKKFYDQSYSISHDTKELKSSYINSKLSGANTNFSFNHQEDKDKLNNNIQDNKNNDSLAIQDSFRNLNKFQQYRSNMSAIKEQTNEMEASQNNFSLLNTQNKISNISKEVSHIQINNNKGNHNNCNLNILSGNNSKKQLGSNNVNISNISDIPCTYKSQYFNNEIYGNSHINNLDNTQITNLNNEDYGEFINKDQINNINYNRKDFLNSFQDISLPFSMNASMDGRLMIPEQEFNNREEKTSLKTNLNNHQIYVKSTLKEKLRENLENNDNMNNDLDYCQRNNSNKDTNLIKKIENNAM